MRVSVVGGSIGGLTAALLLRDLGHEVTVYERSPRELTQRGAGIGLMPETSRYLTECAGVVLDDFSISTSRIRYLSRDGIVTHEEAHPYRFSSWNTVYRRLLSCLEPSRYKLDHEMVSWSDPSSDRVTVSFSNGTTATSELVVFADGVASVARTRLQPDSAPHYSGYVAWRGMVPETKLSDSAHSQLDDAITYHVYANSHILVYPIPGLQGETEPGKRLINYVWYRNYSIDGDLEDLLTDNQGERRDVSIPPGSVAERHVHEMKAHALARLPEPVAEVVSKTAEPFVQVVFDQRVHKMAFGRTCLLGDAAFLGRPHAAAGTAKAADDAWALREAIRSHASLEDALIAYEQTQCAVGNQLVDRTERIGRRSQFDGTWTPGDPELIFGLKGPGA